MTETTSTALLFRIGLFAVVLCISLLYTVMAFTFHPLTSYAPITAGGAASVLLLVTLVREIRRLRLLRAGGDARYSQTFEMADEPITRKELTRSVRYIGIALAYASGVYLFGMVGTSMVFVAVMLIVDARASMQLVIASVLAIPVAFWLLGWLMALEFPSGALWS